MHPDVSMNVIGRTKTELFTDTVENACKANPGIRLVINGSYGNNTAGMVLVGKIAPQAPDQEIEGQVIIGERYYTGSSEPNKASVAWDTNAAPGEYTFALGNPDPSSTGALGGLVPLILGGKTYGLAPPHIPNTWFTSVNQGGSFTGRLALARSAEWGHLLVYLQPYGGADAIMSVEQLRDRLYYGDMADAVLLDGSDSVMMYFDGVWKVRQSTYKQSVTRIGLVFWAEHPNQLPSYFHGSRTPAQE
jgi:hypothetical protein